ncbi:hypothetical protein NMG60_11018739 [Bertholletia excelsa]
MLKHCCFCGWTSNALLSSPPLLLPGLSDEISLSSIHVVNKASNITVNEKAHKPSRTHVSCRSSTSCRARRRVRYNEDDEDEEEEEYGHNAEIAMLELYSQSARDEALLVTAEVDKQEAEVLIFKGFSSCLSYSTSPDPTRGVLPARAVIKSIDRIKGPFDPSNIHYLEKGLSWETFKTRLPALPES